jgi:tetratricopeptide (TPR) repeat protein
VPTDPITVAVATALANKAVDSTWAGAARLTRVVRRRFARDPEATAALDRAQDRPGDSVGIQELAEALQSHLEIDAMFRRELARWVEESRHQPAVAGSVAQIAGQAEIGTVVTANVVHVGVPLSIAQLSPPAAAQLPLDIAHFTGRQAELAHLHALMAQEDVETVVISAIAGTGGVGKTALAVHLAHQLAPQFPDAQLYVNLHGYEPHQRLSPAQVLDRFLRALGVPAEALPTDVDEQAALYRSVLAGKRALVVLDNASSPDQVRHLLPASPTCGVLVTSRDSLAALVAQEGARLLDLDVLAPGEALELLSRIAGPDRIAAETEAAAEVAQLCGYLPLAVSIAGARLATRPVMRLAALAGRLRDEQHRLRELAAGDLEVRASFALSYRALDAEAARLFRHLGLIAGPDFAPGVAAVLTEITPERAEELLEALVDAHLVEATSTPGRYRFHDLLRLYARERLHSEETDADQDGAVGRLLNWYLDHADAAAGLVSQHRGRYRYRGGGPIQRHFTRQTQALAWFEAERPSLVAATHQAATWGLHTLAWKLPDALGIFFSFRNQWADWQETLQVGLAAVRKAQDRQAEARMLLNLGEAHRLYSYLNGCEEAIEYHQRALAIFREIEDREGEARALGWLASDSRCLYRGEDAIEWWQMSLATYREIGDRFEEGYALTCLGHTYRDLRRLEEALDVQREALAIFKEIGEDLMEADIFRYLGGIYTDLHRVDEATESYEEAVDHFQLELATSQEVGDRWGEGEALLGLGNSYRDLRRFEEALECYEQAPAVFAQVGNRWGEDSALGCLGRTYCELGRLEEAIDHCKQALALAREMRSPDQDEPLRALVKACCGLGRFEEAIDHCELAVALYRDVGERHLEAVALDLLGLALRDSGDIAQARACWREALEIFMDLGVPEVNEVRARLEDERTVP